MEPGRRQTSKNPLVRETHHSCVEDLIVQAVVDGQSLWPAYQQWQKIPVLLVSHRARKRQLYVLGRTLLISRAPFAPEDTRLKACSDRIEDRGGVAF